MILIINNNKLFDIDYKLFTDIDYQHADGKKSAWVPDKSTGGYLEGLCENDMKVAKNNKTRKENVERDITTYRWPRITKQQRNENVENMKFKFKEMSLLRWPTGRQLARRSMSTSTGR